MEPWSEAMSVTTMGVCIRCHAAKTPPNRLPNLPCVARKWKLLARSRTRETRFT